MAAMMTIFSAPVLLAYTLAPAPAVTMAHANAHGFRQSGLLLHSLCAARSTSKFITMAETARPLVTLEVPLANDAVANLRFRPTLPSSEPVIVQYSLPFGLNVENKGGRAVCTKDGPGGEREGDVLRFTTAWSMGLPQGDGLLSTAASFGGAIGWQLSLFDVNKAKTWDEVVNALVSNTPERTDSVTLVFERPTPQ